MDGLSGGLIRAAGPGDHGSVGGLAVKALCLLGAPHDDYLCVCVCVRGWVVGGWTPDLEMLTPTLTNHQDLPHGAGYVTESTLCSMQARSGWRKQTRQSTFHGHPAGKEPRR